MGRLNSFTPSGGRPRPQRTAQVHIDELDLALAALAPQFGEDLAHEEVTLLGKVAKGRGKEDADGAGVRGGDHGLGSLCFLSNPCGADRSGNAARFREGCGGMDAAALKPRLQVRNGFHRQFEPDELIGFVNFARFGMDRKN
jgi:hypothetical protein